MKNNYSSSTAFSSKESKRNLKRIITAFVVLIFLLPFNNKAQVKTIRDFAPADKGLRMSFFVSAAGFGGLTSPQFYYEQKKLQVFAGPVLQKGFKHLSGGMFGCEYSVTGTEQKRDNDWATYEYATNMQLFFFANAIVQRTALLSKMNADIEERVALREGTPIGIVRLKTLELYGGFGVRVNCLKSLKWIGSIGIGGYYTAKNSYNLYREKTALGIILNTGLSWSFNTNQNN
ncbi:MAG: hypothetical protein IAF38_13575 [Bacteroidia bacterium]|nr:hypothetical protein [Bacteroidia bacterium]